MADGTFVEAACLEFHHLSLLADVLNSERTDKPFGAAFDKTFHILPANQWDVLAEFLAIEIEQGLTVPRFLRLHLLEHLGGGWISFAKPVGEIAVNAPVFFLEKNRQCQNFPLGKLLETLFRHRCPRDIKSRKRGALSGFRQRRHLSLRK